MERTSGLTALAVVTILAGLLALVPAQPALALTDADLRVETVATGLDTIWEMRFLPDGDLLLSERPGRIVKVELPEGTVVPVGQVPTQESGEGGLMGLALDPDYPGEPFIYVAYTYQQGGGTFNRLSRFAFNGSSLGAETVLVNGIPGSSIHDGARVAFGPDGFLYMTTGDAANADLAQNASSLAGKVLRMTKSGAAAPGNPTAGSRVFTLGHRNPQGLAFHPTTGQPFVTEHGPDRDDEVNRLQAGRNYGWPVVGGSPGDPRFVDALRSWTPTIAPAGALFFTGTGIPDWRGSFLFVTLKGQDLRRLIPADQAFSAVAAEQIFLNERFGRLRAIAQGADGALYLGTSNRDGRGTVRDGDDRILRITQTTAGTTFSDVPSGHRFSNEINTLAARGVLAGYGDGRFGPEDPVKRAQMAKILTIALGGHTAAIEATQATFTDVARSSDPYPFDFVEEAAARAWVQGFGDGTFHPYANVTRAQLALMLVRAGELPPPPADFQSPFTDVPGFAAEAVRTAFFHGITAGKTATTFDPFSPATRSQVARLVFTLLEELGRL